MIALKLVRLIEAHSEELSLGLTQKILSSERTKDYRKLPEHEMRAGALEIYQHLSGWLLTKTDSDIELRYTRLGELRAQQGISLSHFVWAIALTKEHLWGFLRREALLDRVIELFGELELLQLLDRFFDNALYYSSVSYQKTQDRRKAA